MQRMSLVRGLVAAAMLMPHAGAMAANTDPDWPCMQRKVPQLSLGQVWNGPELPPAAKDWSEDPTSNNHVMRLLARDNKVLWLNSIATRTPSLGSSSALR